jgi:predicted nucleic acid-binding protein
MQHCRLEGPEGGVSHEEASVKVLLDTNVILDVALEREPFHAAAARILETSDFSRFHLFISASMATDVFYVIRKEKGKEVALASLKDLLDAVDVCEVDKNILLLALQSGFGDFEDAVQFFAAVNSEVECIVTRNKKDYEDSSLKVFEPGEFVDKYLSAT